MKRARFLVMGAWAIAVVAWAMGREPSATAEQKRGDRQQVSTFADWPKAKVGDLPAGTMFTQDGDDLLRKLNDEYQVPALFTREGGVIGNGTVEEIRDKDRVVGVVRRGGAQVLRKVQ